MPGPMQNTNETYRDNSVQSISKPKEFKVLRSVYVLCRLNGLNSYIETYRMSKHLTNNRIYCESEDRISE